MALGYTVTVRNNMLQTIIDAIDAGVSMGFVNIYDGTRPATGGAGTTLLAQLEFSKPCGTKAAGVLTFSAITQDTSANATGTATWFRAVNTAGTPVLDGNISTSGSDMNLNTLAIMVGAAVQISSFTITEGNP